nr:hypothetical protein [Tanacetum cinerariifolium]
MTSFGYRSNPRYAIKECSSCGTLYTRDCVCSIGTVGDKILVPKPPKNCARCTRCGYLVDGPNCQGCALLRQKLEENLVTYSLDFQNTSKPSNASTNIVNASREPYVVKQDSKSFVDKIIFDLNRAPDSPNQFHCFHCKDVLRDGEACKRCTCAKCGSSLGKGLCYICEHNQNSLNDSPRKTLILVIIVHEMFRTRAKIKDQMTSITSLCEMACQVVQKKLEEKQIEEERAAKAKYWKLLVCYDDDDDEERSDSLDDNIIYGLPPFSAITPDETVLSTEEPDNALKISSGSTTTPLDISLLEYEAFYDDHVKEISSGSPTTHSNSSLYASFIFDLLINLFPPADRSDSYEFTDELIPFISPPEYDCFLFKVEPNSWDFTKDAVEDISPTKEPQVLNTLPAHPTLQLNMKFQPSSEYLFTYVIWIFLPFLVYSVVPHYLLSLRNEDTIFDPGICKSTFSRLDISHRCETVKKFNTHHSHLNKYPMLIHG